MGCDIRILQIEGAKDPDEFVVKYGPERFQKQVDKAISLVEYKVKVLRNTLNIEQTNDKIKFLKEIAKVLSQIDNEIEREVYADKISREYQISKEAIYAEIEKLKRPVGQGKKLLESAKPQIHAEKKEEVVQADSKRERLMIYLLVNYPGESYLPLKQTIAPEDFTDKRNQEIVRKLYEEIEKGNSNISTTLLDCFEDEETINYLSWIMAYDFEITELDKCIEDVINSYTKEKTIKRRNEIIKQLEDKNISREEAEGLEKELNDIIISLAKMK